MKEYDPKKIESKWQKYWEKNKLFEAKPRGARKKFYGLVEFPYPSGEGMHVGHIRSYTAMDVITRKRRAEGYSVLYPMGWDAFGLPTENYAVKTGIHPKVVTRKNTDNFRRQLKLLGFSFDWTREINTSDPDYYKWTQWIFLQFFKRGLAYKAKMPINWCLNCKIGLANEEVVNERCERCGGPTERREKEQWILAITKYADRLDKDLDRVDYLERIKIQQRNWIGRSEGTVISFQLLASNFKKLTTNSQSQQLKAIDVFTTRPDTIFGATFLAISAELAQKWLDMGRQTSPEVKKFVEKLLSKRAREKSFKENPEKYGIPAGITAINPASGEELPVWVVNYVLGNIGTGAIMGVPAHDERDLEFAKKYSLRVKEAISEGVLINSGKYSGMLLAKAGELITKEFGEKSVQYKLRDWIFSRQRYWGEPIPLVFCETEGKWIAVPEKDLPVKLPDVKNFKPTESGESPLASIKNWVETRCPECGGKARRETDTMPNWAGSSWYYLRYTDPQNKKEFASKKKMNYWLGVDWYNGGMEHTTLHLLYSRFWHKFLFDLKLVPGVEPYTKRTSHGLILAAGGEKMSKSKGNIVSPDSIVKIYGADTLRVYEMFMGPFDQAIAWSADSVAGSRKFLERVWRLQKKVTNGKLKVDEELETLAHQTIKKVSEDIENMKFNTAVSQLMVFLNELERGEAIPVTYYRIFLQLLYPFAPHISEELWSQAGEGKSLALHSWPIYDSKKISQSTFALIIQVDGRVRDQVKAPYGLNENEAKKLCLEREKVKNYLVDKRLNNVIFVPNKLINFVTRER